MTEKSDGYFARLEKELADCRREDAHIQRKTALLTAIIRIFRESLTCATKEEVTRISLRVAEELTGSAIGFIGELNEKGRSIPPRSVTPAGMPAKSRGKKPCRCSRTCRDAASTGSGCAIKPPGSSTTPPPILIPWKDRRGIRP
jgi:hypothetical protein